jgi:hypothetical protein
MTLATSFTAYLFPGQELWSDNASTGEYADETPKLYRDIITSPAVAYRTQDITLLSTDTAIDITPSIYAVAEKMLIVIKVSGRVRVTTTAKDYNGSSDITGITDVYGTEYFKGVLVLSTYNTSAISLSGLAASSTVSLATITLVETTDSRL